MLTKEEAKKILHQKVDEYLITSNSTNADVARINEFTHKALDLAPDYFWTRPASRSHCVSFWPLESYNAFRY